MYTIVPNVMRNAYALELDWSNFTIRNATNVVMINKNNASPHALSGNDFANEYDDVKVSASNSRKTENKLTPAPLFAESRTKI
ncbi:hypothetical protein BLOT_000422 [Blomia tropicalis]|nr:hypothetical protein BLOT_000422 [Blomia tropicalis]